MTDYKLEIENGLIKIGVPWILTLTNPVRDRVIPDFRIGFILSCSLASVEPRSTQVWGYLGNQCRLPRSATRQEQASCSIAGDRTGYRRSEQERIPKGLWWLGT